MNEVMTKKNLLFYTPWYFAARCGFGRRIFLFLQPLNNELKSKQAELKMANQQLTIIENKLSNITVETANSTMKLQKHIPVKRSVEQLMLEIEKAEIISNVQISSIAMGSAGSDESIEAKHSRVTMIRKLKQIVITRMNPIQRKLLQRPCLMKKQKRKR